MMHLPQGIRTRRQRMIFEILPIQHAPVCRRYVIPGQALMIEILPLAIPLFRPLERDGGHEAGCFPKCGSFRLLEDVDTPQAIIAAVTNPPDAVQKGGIDRPRQNKVAGDLLERQKGGINSGGQDWKMAFLSAGRKYFLNVHVRQTPCRRSERQHKRLDRRHDRQTFSSEEPGAKRASRIRIDRRRVPSRPLVFSMMWAPCPKCCRTWVPCWFGRHRLFNRRYTCTEPASLSEVSCWVSCEFGTDDDL